MIFLKRTVARNEGAYTIKDTETEMKLRSCEALDWDAFVSMIPMSLKTKAEVDGYVPHEIGVSEQAFLDTLDDEGLASLAAASYYEGNLNLTLSQQLGLKPRWKSATEAGNFYGIHHKSVNELVGKLNIKEFLEETRVCIRSLLKESCGVSLANNTLEVFLSSLLRELEHRKDTKRNVTWELVKETALSLRERVPLDKRVDLPDAFGTANFKETFSNFLRRRNVKGLRNILCEEGRALSAKIKIIKPVEGWKVEKVRQRTRVGFFAGSGRISYEAVKAGFLASAVDVTTYEDSLVSGRKTHPRWINKNVFSLQRQQLTSLFSSKLLWFSPPCPTWSRLAQWLHGRTKANKMRGRTEACRVSNSMLTWMLSWLKTVQLKPSEEREMQFVVVEAPFGVFDEMPEAKELESLGLQRCKVSWCYFDNCAQKHTLLYTNVPEILQTSEDHLCHSTSRCPECTRTGQEHPESVDGNTSSYLHFPMLFCSWIIYCVVQALVKEHEKKPKSTSSGRKETKLPAKVSKYLLFGNKKQIE